MRTLRFDRYGLFALPLLALILAGCFGTSQSSRFYTLSSLAQTQPNQAPAGPLVPVAVGPIGVPDYLDREEIVTRVGQNEMRVNDFQRWAGSFEGNLSRAIVDDLSALLSPDGFSVVRWNPVIQAEAPRYRVAIDITRFDVTPGGPVVLDANWTLYGKDRSVILFRKSGTQGTAVGKEFADLVATMSKAVEDLSREIADAVRGQGNAPAPVNKPQP
jgi:uncharacterized lipoprotein YmbA